MPKKQGKIHMFQYVFTHPANHSVHSSDPEDYFKKHSHTAPPVPPGIKTAHRRELIDKVDAYQKDSSNGISRSQRLQYSTIAYLARENIFTRR